MRITFNGWFVERPDTGSGQYVRHLLRALAQLQPDGEVQVIRPDSGDWRLGIRGRALQTSQSPLPGLQPLYKLWFEQVVFPRACRGADVAHVPYFAAPLRPAVPTVVTIHDLVPLLLPAYRRSVLVRAYMRLVAAGARRADAIIADSQASKRDIVRCLRVPAERVHVVYLAAGERFQPPGPEEAEGVRRKYGVPDSYVLYLGGFDVRKNVPTLLRAFARLVAFDQSLISGLQSPPCLVIAGRLPRRDTTFTPDPRRLARELGVAEQVVFPGWVDEADLPGLYGGAIFFVYPSQYEGFGLPPLEAMACGTPVIVSAAASLPEVVGDAGLTVPPDEVEALTEAMATLLANEEQRHALRQAGLAQAARFCWERTAAETLRVYEYCITRNTQYAAHSVRYATRDDLQEEINHGRPGRTPQAEP